MDPVPLITLIMCTSMPLALTRLFKWIVEIGVYSVLCTLEVQVESAARDSPKSIPQCSLTKYKQSLRNDGAMESINELKLSMTKAY